MSAVTAVPIRPLSKGTVLKLWIGIVLLCLAAGALAWWQTAPLQVQTLQSGVRLRTVQAGTGEKITPNDAVALRYKLHVNGVDAPVIQDSDESGQPFFATTSDVFPGFAEGLQQMQQGGRYVLWLPPGTHVPGPVPPGTPFRASDTLVFEIQVVQVAAGQAQALQMQRMQQMMQQQQQMQAQNPHGGASGGAPAGGSPDASPPSGAARPRR